MISYLLTSILLSTIGWCVYRLLLQVRGTLSQRRLFLQVVVVSSLIIPLFLPHKPIPSTEQALHHQQAAFGLRLDPAAVQQHCRCQNPDYTHRISYRTNAFYNFVLSLSPILSNLMLGLFGLVLIRLSVQLGFLLYLTKQGPIAYLNVKGRDIRVIRPRTPLPVGAFWLGQAFLIWQEELEELDQAERQAILAHEWTHLCLGHPVERTLLRFIQCVWFLNPIFYLLQGELEGLAEFEADEAGAGELGSRKAYAHLLLNFKGQGGLTLAQHFGESQLTKRIKRLIAPPSGSSVRYAGWLLLPLLAVQVGIARPVHDQIDQSLQQWQAYQRVQPHLTTERPQVLYCQDCETVCSPEEVLSP